MIDFTELKRAFEEYADGYFRQADERLVPLLELKRRHSHLVQENALELATRMNLPQEERLLAEAAGLLHDVGRFPQLLEYRTFQDRHSIDHGERGWMALQESEMISQLPPGLHDTISAAVRWHNKKELPEYLSRQEQLITGIVRDADRIDIYRVFCEAIENGDLDSNPEIQHDLPAGLPPSPQIAGNIRARNTCSYDDMHSMTDFLLLILSWVFHMHCPQSLSIIRERAVLDRIAPLLPDFPECREILDEFRIFIESAGSE